VHKSNCSTLATPLITTSKTTLRCAMRHPANVSQHHNMSRLRVSAAISWVYRVVGKSEPHVSQLQNWIRARWTFRIRTLADLTRNLHSNDNLKCHRTSNVSLQNAVKYCYKKSV